MHHIVFDTNVLRNEHFHSPRMKILKRLVGEEEVKLYIPEIVRREFLTQKLSEYQEKLKTKDIIDVDKFFTRDWDSCKDKLSKAEKLIKEVHGEIDYLIELEFDEWVSEYKIEILHFDNSKMTEVMNNYFTGGTVFKTIKSRKDIPDAMICESIEQLCSEVGEITVLINDTTFKKHLSTIFGIHTFSTTTELLENEEIVNVLHTLDKRNKRFNLLHGYLSSK